MADSFDPRVVRVGVEIAGKLNVFEGLHMTASGKKFANPLQNECEVRLMNLRKDARDFLLTEASPYNGNKSPKRLIVEAGRESIGAFQLFSGDITECSVAQPPDIVLTLKAKTGQYSKGLVLSRSMGASTPLSTIARAVADSLKLDLVFEARDRNVANYAFTGGALKEVDKLGEAGGVNAFVDDGRLIVKDYNAPLSRETHVLSARSGMVGVPELTEQGVKVRYLLDPATKLGGRLTIESELNPAANGDYVIYGLSFEVATRDTPFYYIAECKRQGAK